MQQRTESKRSRTPLDPPEVPKQTFHPSDKWDRLNNWLKRIDEILDKWEEEKRVHSLVQK